MMMISGDELQTFKLFTKSSKWVLVCVFISENRRGLIPRHTLQMAWDPLFIGILESLTRYRVGFYTVPCSNWHVPELFCLFCELATVPCNNLHGTMLDFLFCLFPWYGSTVTCLMKHGAVFLHFLVFSSVFLRLFACFFVWGLVSPEIVF